MLLVAEKFSKQLQRNWEDRLKANIGVVAVRAESFRENRQIKSVGQEETLFQTFLPNHVD